MNLVTDPDILKQLGGDDSESTPPAPVPPLAPAKPTDAPVDERLKPISDPDLLAKLNAPDTGAPSSTPKPVSDPDLLAKLNEPSAPTGAAPGIPAGAKDWHSYIPRYIQIESGGNPNAVTGSYRGIFQMGPDEIARYGGSGYNEGVRLLEDRAASLQRSLGRPPTPTEVYMAHQQGPAGVLAHLSNPDAPAWQNMYSTGEGQRRGANWAKRAIWGNVPDDLKRQYGLTPGPGGFSQDVASGALDNFSSNQFVNGVWARKVEGAGAVPGARYAGGVPQATPAGYPPNATAQYSPVPEGATAVTDPELLKQLNTPIDPRLQRAPDADVIPADTTAPSVQPSAPAPDRAPTSFESLARGYYSTKGMVGGAAEMAGEIGGYPSVSQWGTDVREQAKTDAASYPAAMTLSQANSFGDYARWAKDQTLEMAPAIATAIAAPLVGGAALGTVGTAAGVAIPAAVLGFGGVESALKESDPNAKASASTVAGGAAVAALNTVYPLKFAGVLGAQLTAKFGAEAAASIAERIAAKVSANSALGYGKAVGENVLLGGALSATQEAITEAAVAGTLDRPLDYDELPGRLGESFASGGLVGGILGAGHHALRGRTRAEELPGELPGTEPPPPGAEPPPPAPPEGGPPGGPPGTPPVSPPVETPPPGGFPPAHLPVGTWENQTVPSDAVQFQPITGKHPAHPSGVDAPPPLDSRAQYDVVRDTAAASLPSAGTPEEMLRALHQGSDAVRLAELGIPDWLAQQKGKVQKGDVLAQIEANSLRMRTEPAADAGQPGGQNPRVHALDMPPEHKSEPELVRDRAKLDEVNRIEAKQAGGEILTPEEQAFHAENAPRRTALASALRDPESLVDATTKDRTTTDGKSTLHVEGMVEHPLAETSPTRTTSAELMLRRLVQQAALEGKDRVSWTPGAEAAAQARAAGADRATARGIKNFYDKELPRIANKIAAKLPEARTGSSYIDVPGEAADARAVRKGREVPYIEMTQRTREAVLGKGIGGLDGAATDAAAEARLRPLGSGEKVEFVKPASNIKGPWQLGNLPDARVQLKQAGELIWRIARKLGINKKLEVLFYPGDPWHDGTMARVWGVDKNGKYIGGGFLRGMTADHYVIEFATGVHDTIETAWASLTHELGHVVQGEFYDNASPLLKAQIDQAYKRYLQERKAKGVDTLGKLFWTRDNFLVNWHDMRTPEGYRKPPGEGRSPPGEPPNKYETPFADLKPRERQYWLGMEEWFAEQVARHFTTSQPILNAVDRFFAKIGNSLRELYKSFMGKFGVTATPDEWIRGWLDSRLTEMPTIAMANELNNIKLADANTAAMHSIGVKDYPQTELDPTSIPGRKLVSAVGETPEARSMATAADRFNGFYKYMLSVVQVAARNLHIQPLQRYVERWQQKQLERAQMMSAAVDVLRAWRNLGKKHADNVGKMLDAYMNYDYLTPQEAADGIVRRPTQPELAEMQKRIGLSEQGRKVFDSVVNSFDGMLAKYEGMLRAEAMKIADPAEQAKRLLEISEQVKRMRDTPYAPALRFGDLTLLVKDSFGNVVSRYHFETEGQRKRAEASLTKKLLAGEYIEKSAIPEQAKPFTGLPPGLLDLIAEKLNLSDVQRKAIAELKYEYSPAHGFQHRFQRKSYVPGYSMDFMRAYASYFFHGSNYFTNVKYIQALRDEIGLVKLSADGLTDGTKRMQIHNFLQNHLEYMNDPKPDFAHMRGFMFHWALGFSPAAAFINLSQMAIGSYPFLAGKFGDLGTIGAMTRAGVNLSTFLKRGTLAARASERDMRALSEGVKQGIITEAMAPELAGMSEQDNLRPGAFGKKAELLRLFSEASSFMFQTTEQINRRVTFRAAWQLALDNPAAKYVKEMILKHSLQYESLLKQGWAENEAAAFVVAKDAVESTQFIYSQWANPAFMRGRLRTAFIFKNFLQNTMFMLWHYPEARVRSLLVFGMLGGIMGLPGADDLQSIIKGIGWRLFGKDWDPEQEARNLIINVTNGSINPDLLLHGSSRYGFGMHAIMGLMGVPFPTLDLSRSIGLGRLLPVDVNTLIGQGATKDPKGAAMDAVTQLGGYAFQTNANFYNALLDSQLSWDDAQRWTKAMPRALSGLSRTYQALRGPDPAIRTRTGAAVIRFDTSDTPQMMEALSMSAGFQPLRLTQKWDVIMAQRDQEQFWDLKRQALLRQATQAKSNDDEDNFQRVMAAIRDYNDNLPDEARAKVIKGSQITESIKTHMKSTTKLEAGLPTTKTDYGIVQEIQRLYPGAEIDVRRTR